MGTILTSVSKELMIKSLKPYLYITRFCPRTCNLLRSQILFVFYYSVLVPLFDLFTQPGAAVTLRFDESYRMNILDLVTENKHLL